MGLAKHSPALLLLALLGSAARADDNELLAQLDRSLASARDYIPGGDDGPLLAIEQIVFQLPPASPLRAGAEQRLVAALDAATTPAAKRFLCSQLRVIGTAQCVPSLERLLPDPEAGHLARYALGSMELPEAAAALCRALDTTTGKLQVGILNTLGDRGCAEAEPLLVALLGSSDPAVAEAAARALGRLGGDAAIASLWAARDRAAGPAAAEQRAVIEHALLQSAEQRVAGGQADAAAEIYGRLHQGALPALRLACLRGLALSRPTEAAGLLVDAIRGGDPGLSKSAISLTRSVRGEAATKAFVAALPALNAEDRVLMLEALGARGDRAAAPAIRPLAASPQPEVRVAALAALGRVGDDAAVAVLMSAAAGQEGAERDVARRSLVLLDLPAVDAALLAEARGGQAGARVEAIRALAGRNSAGAVAVLRACAEDPTPEVRREAMAALGALAGRSDLETLVALAARSSDPADGDALVQSLGKLFARIGDPPACAAAVLAQLSGPDVKGRPALIRLLGKTPDPRGLAALRAAWRGADAAGRDAAVQALAEWPDPAAAGDLLEVIAEAPAAEPKQLALRGYLRLAAASGDPAAAIVRALERVESVNDKKLVLAELGLQSDSLAALDLALNYLEPGPLRPTAGLAALRIANRLKDRERQRAREALERVVSTVDHADVRQRALEVINDMEKYDDHILQWLGAGPYTEKGKDGAAVYAAVFPPESGDAASVAWKPIQEGIGSWDINLESTFGGLDYCAAYVRTRVWSDTDREAMLELGSDDAVKAWVNGQLVFDKWTERGASPRQERAPIKLVKGWNMLLLKVVDQQGGWVFGCRVRQPDGTQIEGLRVEP